MTKLFPFFLIIAAFGFFGCPYSANVPLSTGDSMSFDPRILGHWKSPYLTAEINGLWVSKSSKGQLIAIEYSVENGKIKYDKDTLLFTPTKVGDVFFIDQKSDTANLWTAHPYFFSLGGNVLSTYSLNDTIIGKDRKFASTAEYRNYVAANIYRPGFLENPDVMMRATDGELRGEYVDLMVTDSILMHIDKIAYSLRVSEDEILRKPGPEAQKNIRKNERRIKRSISGLKIDSVYTDNDHGYSIKQYCLTAKNPANLDFQKNAFRKVKNVAIEPIAVFYQECYDSLSPKLNARIAALATEMASGEFKNIQKAEIVVALDPFDEHAESLKENQLHHAMTIGNHLMKSYQTIYNPEEFTFDAHQHSYWKVGICRVYLK